MADRNARLTVHGRRQLIARVVTEGRPVVHVVTELGRSRSSGYTWPARWRADGDGDGDYTIGRVGHAGPPHKTPAWLEQRVCQLTAARKRGPRRLRCGVCQLPR